MFDEYKMPVHSCPTCGYKMDRATGMAGRERSPMEGDLTFCLNCGALLIFKEDLSVESVENDFEDQLDKETKYHISKTREAIRKVHERRNIHLS